MPRTASSSYVATTDTVHHLNRTAGVIFGLSWARAAESAPDDPSFAAKRQIALAGKDR